MTPHKIAITCAVTGNAPFNRKHPNFPVTPKQICAAAVEAAQAGASAVHLHVRDPQTGLGSFDRGLFSELVDRVRQTGIDIVLNLTCGGGGFLLPDPSDESRALPSSDIQSAEIRVRHIEDNLPEICSLDVTTGNQVEGNQDFVYLNTPYTLRRMARRFQELGVKPELEVFQPGDVLLARKLIEDGLIDGPPLFQLVLGVSWGAPADSETMIYMRNLLPPEAIWAGFGIGRQEMPMTAQAILLGGNVRVGLEDNLYLKRGVFATNGQLVERARALIEYLGHEIATPADMREAQGLRLPQ